jgi:hypothetical protein
LPAWIWIVLAPIRGRIAPGYVEAAPERGLGARGRSGLVTFAIDAGRGVPEPHLTAPGRSYDAGLTEDATFWMPPQPTWFGGEGGPEEMAAFMAGGPLSGAWRWKHVLTTADAQPTLAFYCWYEPERIE